MLTNHLTKVFPDVAKDLRDALAGELGKHRGTDGDKLKAK